MPSFSMPVPMLWACADLRYAAVSRSQGLGAGCVDLAAIPISICRLGTCNLLLAVTREPHLSPGSWVDGRTLSPKVYLCGSRALHACPGPLFARKRTVAEPTGFSSQSGVCLQGCVPHPTPLKPSIEILS